MDISSSLDAFEQAPEYTALAPEDRAKALDGWKSWAVKSFTGPEDTPEVTDQLVEEALSAKKSRERSRLRPDNTGILPPLVPDWGEVSADPAFAQLGTPERQKVADSWAARKAAQLNQVALTSEDRASWLVQREAAKRQAAGEQGLPEVSDLLRPVQYQAFTEARNPVLPTGLVQADPTTGGLSVHPALALRSKEEYDRMIDEALPGGSPEALDEKAKYDARRGAALGAVLSGLGAQEDTEARNLWTSLLPGTGLIDRTVNEFFDISPDLKITVPDPVSGKNITKVIPGDEASFYISDVREARYKSDGASAEPLLSSDPDIREPAEQKLLDDLGRHVLPNLDLELAERVRKNPQSEEARAIITEMQDKLRRELWVEPDEAKKNSFEQVRILSDGEAVWNPELIDSMSRPEIQSAVASLSLPEDRAQQILEQGLRERQQKAQEEVSNIRLLGPVEGDDSSFSVSMFGPTTDAYRSFVLSKLDSAEFKEGRIDEADILAEWKAKNTGVVPAVRVAGQRALSAAPEYLAELTLMLSGFAAAAVNKIGIDTPEFSQWINDNFEASQVVQQIAAKSETTGVQRIAGMLGREGPFLLTGVGVGIRAGLAAATANTLAQNALKEAIVTLGRRRAASSAGMGVGVRKTAEEYRAVIRAFALKERATASARALRDGTGAAMLTYQGLQASRSSVDTYQNVYVALKQKGIAEGLSEQAAQERARTGAIAPAITSGVITGTLMKQMPGGVEALVARAGGKVPLKQLAASAGPAKLAEVLRSKTWIAPAAGVIASVFNGVLKEAAEESLDEFMQVVVQSDYDESLTLNDAVSAAVEAAVVGGIMGGLSGGVTGVSDLRSLALKNREDKIAHARDMAKKAAKVDRLIEDLEEKQAPQTAEALADLLEGKAQDRIDAEIKALTELGMSSVPLEAEDGVPISGSDATYESAAFATDIEATGAMAKLRTRFDEILAKDPTHPVGEFALMVFNDGASGYRVHAIRDEGSVADFKARLEQNIKPGTEGVAAPAAEGEPAPLTEGTPPPAEGETTPPAEGETTPPADTAPAPGDPLPELSVQEGDRAELPAVLEGLDEFRRAVQGRMRQTGTGTKAVTAFREKLEKVNALVREIAGLYRRYFATEKGSLEFDLVSDELAAALSKMDGMLAASPAVRQRVKQKVRPPAVIEEEAAKAAAEPEAAAEAENLFPDRVPTGEAADAAVGAVQAAFAAEENKPRRAALRKNAAAMANAEAAYTNDPSAENELTLLKAARNMRSRFAAGSAEYAAVNDLVKDLQSKQDARKEAVRKQKADERAQRAEQRKAAEEARRTAAAQGKAPAAQQPTEPAAAQETKEAAPKPRVPQKMQAAKARAAAGTSVEAAAEVVAAKAPDPAAAEKAAPEEDVLQTEEDDEAFLRFARELGIQSEIQDEEGGRASRQSFAKYFGNLSREVKNRIARAKGFTRDMLSKKRQALFVPAKTLIDAATNIVVKLNEQVAAFDTKYPGILNKRGADGPLAVRMTTAVNAAVAGVQASAKPGQFEPTVAVMAFTAREVLKIAQGLKAKEGSGNTRTASNEFSGAILPLIAKAAEALRVYSESAKAAPAATRAEEIRKESLSTAALLLSAWKTIGKDESLPAERLAQEIPGEVLFLAPESDLEAEGHIRNVAVRAGRLPDLIPKGVPLEALIPTGDISASTTSGGGLIDYTPDVAFGLSFDVRTGQLLPEEQTVGLRTQVEKATKQQTVSDMLSNLDQGTEQRGSRAAHAQEAALPLPEQQRRTEERMRREMKALGLESGSPQSMQTALEKIMGDPNQPAHLRELARMLYEIQAWRLATSFSIVTDPASAAGNYDPATGAITLNLTRPNPRGLADALVHEIFHAATHDAITKKHPAGSPEAAAAEYIQRLYSEAKTGYARRRQTIEGLLESLRELEADALLMHSPQRMRKLLAREKAKKNPLALDYSPDMSLDEVADMFAALQSSKGGYFALSEMIADFDYVFTAPEANGISLEFISHLTDSNFQLLLGNILTEPGTPSMLRRLWQRTTELLFNRVIPGTDRANSLKELLGHVRLLAGDPASMFFSAPQGRKFDGDEAQLAALARDARLKQATEKQAAAAAQLQSAALAIVALEKTDAAELGGITGELLVSRAGAATALGLGNTSSLAIASALRARLQDANSNRKAELDEALTQYAVALDSEEQASREVARLTAEVAAAQPVRGLLPVSAAPGVDPAAAAAAVSEVRPGGTVPVVVEVDLAAAQAQGIEQLNPSALPLRNIRSAEIRDNFVRGMAALSALVDRGVLFPLSEVQQSDGTTRKIILWETEDRYVVVANVNGVRVPFYRSTGYAGKAEKGVPAGVWYPFFGINTSGERWISKGTTKTDDINKSIPDFYGIGELRAIAEQLNEAFPRTKPSLESGVPKKYIADGYTQYLPGAVIDPDSVERIYPTEPGITAEEFNRMHDMVPWAKKDPVGGPITANLNRIREALVPPPAAEETPAEETPPAAEEPVAPAEPQPKNPLVRAAAFRLRGKTLITPADLQREFVLPDLALEGLISELQTEGLIGPVDEKGRHRVRPAKVRALLVAGATDRMGGLLESRAVAYADGNRIRLSISPEFNRRMASGELTVEDYGALDLALQSAEALAEQLFYEGATDEVTEAPQVLGSRPVSFYEAPQWLRDYMRRNNSAFESPKEADEWFASEQPQFLSNPAQWTSGASPDELAMMNWQVSRQIRRLTASGNPDTAMLMPGLAEQAKALSGISRINPFGEDAAEFYAMRTAFDPETHVPLDALKAIGITRSSRVAARTGFFTPGAVRTDPDHLELSAAMNAAYQTAPARTNPDQLLWLSAIMPVAGFNRAMDAYGRGPFTEALERFRNVARKMYPVIPMENLGKLTGMPEFFNKADATIRALTALSGTLDPKVSEEYIGRLTDALELDDRTAAQVERGYMNMVFRDGVADRRSRDAALARLQVDTGEILRGAAEDGAGAGTLEFTGAGGEAVVFADPKQRLVYKMYLPRITGRETGFGFALPAPVIGPDGQPVIEPFESPALGRSPLRQMLLEEHTQVPGLIDSEVVALTDSGAVITVQKQLTGEQIDTDAAAEPMRRWAQMHQATFLDASGIAPNFEAPATQNAVLIRDASGNLRMLLDFAPGNVFAAGPVLAPVDVLVSSPLSAETASHPTVSSAAGQLLGSRPISSPVGKFRAFLLSKRPGEFTKGLPDSRPDEVLNTTKFLWSVNMTRFGKFGRAAYPIRKEMDFRIRSLAQASDRLLNITMSRLPKDNPRIEELANIIAGSQDNLYDENMRMAAVTAFRKARMSAVRRYRKDIRRIRQTAVADEAGPETEAVQKAFDKALADAQADFRTALGEAVDVRVAEYKLEQEAARKELAAIPGGEDVLRAVEALRRKVDELSQYMLETVDLDPEVRVIITRSMGVYLTRTYQAHEDPEYMAMVRSADPVMEKRMSDALEYFQNRQKQEYINRHVIQFGRGSLEEARRAAAAWMAVSGDDAARMALHDFLMEHASVSHSGGSVGVLNRGILLEKTDIPEPLRRLLGQNKSNVAASARTVYELGRYNATHDFLANLQTLLSDADNSRRERIEELSNAQNPTDEDLKELADLEATVYITGDKSVAAKHGLMPFTDPKTGGASSAALGPLQNMYGPPLLVEAVSELTPEQVSTMTRAVQFITARAQMNLTVLSWKSQARNFGANGGWLLGAGHYNIWSAVWKPRVRAFLAASDDQKLAKQQLAEFYARYGVTGGSAISEVLEAISDAAGDNSAESLTRLYEGATGRAVKATRFLADKAAGLQEAAVGLYEKGDDVFKIAIFEAELAEYAKAYGAEFGPSGELIVPEAAIPRIIEVFSGRNRLTRSMLREIGGSREALARELLLREAAAATRDSIAYYDQLPAAIEQFRRSAGIAVAPFVSYRVAMPMAVVGSAKRAWLDMQSPETRGKGLRRYLGLTFLFGGLTKVLGLFFQLAAAAFMGADDEEEKRLLGAHTTTERDLALRSLVSEWYRNRAISFLGITDDKKVLYTDISWLNPVSSLRDTFIPLLANPRLLRSWEDFRAGMVEAASKATEPFISPQVTIADVVKAAMSDDYEAQSRTVLEKAIAGAGAAISSAAVPGVATDVARIIKSMGTSRQAEEITSFIFGLRIKSLDIEQALQTQAFGTKKGLTAAAKPLRALKFDDTASPEDVQEAYQIVMERRKELLQRMRDAFESAKLFRNPSEVSAMLRSGDHGLSRREVADIERGVLSPYQLPDSTVAELFQSDARNGTEKGKSYRKAVADQTVQSLY